MEIKASEQGKFQHCFYRLPTFENSITLGVAREGRELWEHALEEAAPREAVAERRPRPRKIANLGDDALWSNFQIGGTLYVMKGETMYRIGVGGKESDAQRLEKATALARRAMR